MINPQPKYEIFDAESFGKFLDGAMASVRRKELAVEEAEVIAKLADKRVKHNLTVIMDKNRRNDKTPIKFFEPSEKQVLIG